MKRTVTMVKISADIVYLTPLNDALFKKGEKFEILLL